MENSERAKGKYRYNKIPHTVIIRYPYRYNKIPFSLLFVEIIDLMLHETPKNPDLKLRKPFGIKVC